MRYLFGFLCVCALGAMPLVGCSETTGDGGSGGAAGDGGNGGSGGSGGMRECQDPEDCYDANDCTDDTCADGTCEYTRLADGAACDQGNECTTGMCADGECDATPVEDGTACGDWQFGSPGFCVAGECRVACETAQECDDLNDCTADACTPIDGGAVCDYTPVADGTTCAGGMCQAGACALIGTVLPCSEQGIRNAIAAGGGPYTFDCGGPTTIITEATIEIDNDVILDGEGNATLDGNDERQLFSVVEGVTAELHAFTLIRGANNGALYNIGTLFVANSTVSESPGWGIDNDGTMTIANSTISGNTGEAQIFNEGTLTLISSTVVADSIFVDALRTGPARGDREYLTTIAGTLIYGNCAIQQAVTSNGYNIESPEDTCGLNQRSDLVSVSFASLRLGPLQNNGGPTMTHALGADSVAIDHIPAVDCGVTTDQRGSPRPETGGDACDVGSFERQAEDP